METIIRKNITDMPCSLHDCRVTGMQLEGGSLKLIFENGFYIISDGEPIHAVGYVRINGLDPYFCGAYILSRNGKEGAFVGKKLALSDFIDDYADSTFEIVEEAYGYNRTKLQGFLSVKHRIYEFLLDLYHEGDMCYIVNDMCAP